MFQAKQPFAKVLQVETLLPSSNKLAASLVGIQYAPRAQPSITTSITFVHAVHTSSELPCITSDHFVSTWRLEVTRYVLQSESNQKYYVYDLYSW